jgi:hypothetical protein
VAVKLALWHNGGMPVPEACIAEVVSEASSQMHDPSYISGQVDRLIGSQPAISQLVMSRNAQLTVQGVVTVLFHAAVLVESVTRAQKRAPRQLTPADLDRAKRTAGNVEALAADEPHLASYIASNLSEERPGPFLATAQALLAQVARALTAAGSGSPSGTR